MLQQFTDPNNYHGAPLFKRDRNGGVRVWWLEQQGDKYRTHSGIKGGAITQTGWTTCVAKNVGKANATTPESQAMSEVANEYAKKLDRAYFERQEDIDNPVPIKPMLAQKYQDATKREPLPLATVIHFAQPKLDGIRNLATQHGQFSRTGQPTTGAPHIFEELAPWFESDPTLVLDGELYNHEFKDDFNAISSAVRKKNHTPESLKKSREVVQYHIYDVIIEDLTFEQRQAILDHFFASYDGDFLVRVPTVTIASQQQLDTLEEVWVAEGYEGQMVRTNGEYENTRSWNLLKRKTFDTAEFPFIRAEEGNGNWAGVAKRIIVDDAGVEQPCGMRGNKAFAKEVLGKSYTEVTVRYFGRTPDGVLKMPVVIDFHEKKRSD